MKKNNYLDELKKGNITLTNKVYELEEQIKLLKKDKCRLMKENHRLCLKIANLEKDKDYYKKLTDKRDSPLVSMLKILENDLV